MDGRENMGSRKYYQHVEKDPENIKSIWKVLHTTTFVFLILNSLISAYMFGNILKMFNYRCVLHAEPTFDVIESRYFNETHNETILLEPVMKNITETIETQPAAAAVENFTAKDENNTKTEENNSTIAKTGPEPIMFSIFNGTSEKTVNWSNVRAISETLKRSYIYNETIWYKNDSLYGKVNARVRGSDYGSTTSCDLVLFVPLVSLIAAAAFGALTILFGRGRVERSWFMVYPVLIASAIMTILCIIATVSMKNGLQDFCSKFQDYTGFVSCSHYMDYFSFHEKASMRGFWGDYKICYYSYIAAIMLWMIQLVVTILRLSKMADFQFVTVTVDATEINGNGEHEEKIHNALISSGMKPAKELFPSDEEVSVKEINEEFTKV